VDEVEGSNSSARPIETNVEIEDVEAYF